MAKEDRHWLTTLEQTKVVGSILATLKWLGQHWAWVALVLFGLFVVAALFYQPPMGMREPGDTSHAIPGLIGYPHKPGAAEQPVDEAAFEEFLDETIDETYAKARLDQIKLLLIALLIALLPLTYYRGRVARLKRLGGWLKGLWDPYVFGIVSGLILLGPVAISGAYVGLFYNATPEGLYPAMQAIVSSPFNGFMRNLHLWSSEFLLVLLFLHTARVVSTRTYFAGRKLVWVFGAILLTISWSTFLIGTFLRGDQEAFEAWVHLMAMVRFVPLLGNPIADFFMGPLAVMRLYVLHIVITAGALLIIIAPHVLLEKVYVHVQRRWRRAIAYTLGLLGLMLLLSILIPAPFLPAPYHDLEITKPPWPYYFLYAWENIGGAVSMIWSPLLIIVPLFLLPYALEQLPISKKLAMRLGSYVFYVGVLVTLALSYWVAASGIVAHVFVE